MDTQDKEQNQEQENQIEDERLSYVLITLNLEDLIRLFIDNNITFIDLLLLSKEDLKEFQLGLYQRNRIWNFSQYFQKYAKLYTLNEIKDFFLFNKQFIFNPILFEQVPQNNYQLTGSFANYPNNNTNPRTSQQQEESKEKNNEGYLQPVKGKQLPEQKITLSTSKEQLSDEIANNNNPTYPYGAHISKKNLKGKISSQYVYKQYLATNQESNQVLERLNKLKEESEQRQNKYMVLLHKSKNYRMNNDDNYLNNYLPENNDDYEEEEVNMNQDQPLNQNEMQNEDQQEEMVDNNNMDELEIEYEKMVEKIEQIEKMKMEYSSYEYLNGLKKYINDKGENITLDDIHKMNEDIDKLYNIISKKEQLKKSLSDCNSAINEKKKILSDLQSENVKKNDDVGEVEEVEEEYEQESNDQPNYKDHSF